MNDQCLTTHCKPIEHYTLPSRFVTWPQRLLNPVRQWLLHQKQRRLNRKTYKGLSQLDDATLKDIGLTSGDVTWASKLPDSVNAATELEIIARRKPAPDR